MDVAAGYHLIEVPEAGIKIDMPRELAFCDARQYREMAELFYTYQSGVIDLLEFKYLAVYRLLDMKKSKKKSDEILDYESNIYIISDLISSFFDVKEVNGDEQLHIRQGYVHNPLPTSLCGMKTLHGPSDYFANTTFGQYVDGLNHLGCYVSDPHPDHLYSLFAIYYQSDDNYANERYDKRHVEDRIKLARKAYWGDVYGFFLLFASFQNYLTTAAVTWEGVELDLSILYQSPKASFTSRIPGLGMKSMTYVLAETSVFGNLEKVEQTNFWEVILRMYDIKKRDLDELARSEQAKK